MVRTVGLALAVLMLAVPVSAANQSTGSLKAALQRDVNQYLATRSKVEHLSAISLSVSLKGSSDYINVTAGRTEYGSGGAAITPDNIFQIGSNTKAFTSVAILQLEAEGKLDLDQTLGRWLPQYPAWKNVTIRRLLSMTSGIPSYDNSDEMLAAYAKTPKRHFTIPELIAYVYPANPKAPKPTTGYSYSNSNYLLAELIVEKASGDTFSNQLSKRFFQGGPNLSNTFYAPSQYPADVLARLPAGYFVNNDPDNKPLYSLLGSNVSVDSLSWMQGAGGISATMQDLARWVRDLYTGPVLAPKQRAEMESLVSTKTGKPLSKVTPEESRGFGLGVAQMIVPEIGTIWFYEGESLGFRTVHFYDPANGTVVTFSFNSRPPSKDDGAGKLASAVYKTLKTAGY
ncbi:MAG TPA: serine hydrolase domain-containing protein [Candidatus Cybelea sp.]|nr:serine hydrolase domain-containing protein [Candidatus Cybelea sp.]